MGHYDYRLRVNNHLQTNNYMGNPLVFALNLVIRGVLPIE